MRASTSPQPDWAPHATTILGVRHSGRVAIGGDGQVTVGDAVVKHNASKVRKLKGGSILAGGWYDGGSAFDKLDLARYQMSGTGGLLVETRLGPIFIGGSWGEGGRGKFYFSLGRLF